MDLSSQNEIDVNKTKKILEQMGIAATLPLLDEACLDLAKLLAACGDTNGFLADIAQDVLGNINTFCIAVKANPVSFLRSLDLTDEQIDKIKTELV